LTCLWNVSCAAAHEFTASATSTPAARPHTSRACAAATRAVSAASGDRARRARADGAPDIRHATCSGHAGCSGRATRPRHAACAGRATRPGHTACADTTCPDTTNPATCVGAAGNAYPTAEASTALHHRSARNAYPTAEACAAVRRHTASVLAGVPVIGLDGSTAMCEGATEEKNAANTKGGICHGIELSRE
jgi:hypothetical protein